MMDDKLTPPSVFDVIRGSFVGRVPQTDLRIGDRVRSYDFSGVLDTFAEGVIETVVPEMEGCPRYQVRVTRRVMEGRLLENFESHVYPPVNGTPTWTGDVTNLVERLAPRE